MEFLEILKPSWKKIIVFLSLVIILSISLKLILGNPFWLSVTSNSMSPSYNKYDIVFLKSIDSSELKIGDVVLFKPVPYSIWISRIDSINQEEKILSLKGDNNPDSTLYERKVSIDSINSKVIGRIPYLGFIEKYYIGSLIRLVILYILASLIVKSVSQLRQKIY